MRRMIATCNSSVTKCFTILALLLLIVSFGVFARATTATFGDSSVLSSRTYLAGGRALAYEASPTSSGSVTSISIYCGGGIDGTVSVALYDATGSSGGPGKLLTQGSATVDDNNMAWATISVTPYNVVSGTKYWIAAAGFSAQFEYAYNTASKPINVYWTASSFASNPTINDGTYDQNVSIYATLTVSSGVPVNTAVPVISGSTVVGDTLTSSTGTWTNSPTSYTYQWNEGGTAISGATSSTYVLVSSEVGDTITVTVTASNSLGSGSPATSNSVGPVTSGAPANTALPTISGTAQVGDTLTASTGTWTNSPTSYSYQWNAGGTAISGATSSTYTLISGEVGNTITVTVTATNSSGSTSATSSAVGPVTASGAPVNTALPTISGTTQVGDILTASTGTWTNSPTSYSYQWNEDGTAISGATSSSYTLVSGEVGDTITVTVTATNSSGSTPATSSAVGPVTSASSSAQDPGPSAALFASPYYVCDTNYYVSTSGSDTTGTGSSSEPWATLQHANGELPSGGNAEGYCINVVASATAYAGVSISAGGNYASSTGYVVYRCTTMDGCTVNQDASGQVADFYISPGANYVMIDGFTMTNNNVNYGQGVEVYNSNTCCSSHHIWVLNSIITQQGQSGMQLNDGEYFYAIHNTIYANSNASCSAQGSGISICTPKAFTSYSPTGDDKDNPNSLIGSFVTGSSFFHNVVEWNVLYNNALTQCGTAGDAYDTDGNNIIMDTFSASGGNTANYPDQTLIGFNVVYNAGGGGVHIFNSEYVTVANNSCYNNYLDPYNNGSERACIDSANSFGDTYLNNIAVAIPASHTTCAYTTVPYAMWNNAIIGSPPSGDAADTFSNNITDIMGSYTSCQGEIAMYSPDTYSSSSNKEATNPLWVNVGNTSVGTETTQPVGTNFSLQSDSPAIGYGLTETYLPSQSVDVGACAHTLATCP